MADYYARRANLGLIITEAVYLPVGGSVPHADAAVFFGDALEGWKRTVEEVHAAGGLIMPQLHHTGIQKVSSSDNPSMSPSGIALSGKKVKGCAPMTAADITTVRRAYTEAARVAQDLGFDGVAIHAAHGYLLHQFHWSKTNRRTDLYGGSPENRFRLCNEIIADIRAACGKDFPIVLRFSMFPPRFGDATSPYATPELLEAFLLGAVAAGVDCFDCSTTKWWDVPYPERHSVRSLAGWTKVLSGKPTMAGGCVGSNIDNGPTPSYITDVADHYAEFDADCVRRLEELSQRLDEGEFDFAFVSRAVIADAEFGTKIRDGRFAELTSRYNRGTLMRFAEGNHEVPPERFAGVVLPVDKYGKPVLDVVNAHAAGTRVYLPSTVPERFWVAYAKL